MDTPPLRIRVWVIAVVTVALWIVGLAATIPAGDVTPIDLYFAAFTVLAIAGAAKFPLNLRGSRMVMDTAPAIAAIVLLEPVAAIAACVAGKALGQALRPVSNVRRVYNVAAMAIQVAASAAVYARFAPDGPGAVESAMLPIAAAAVILYATNAGLTELTVGISDWRLPFRGWWRERRGEIEGEGVLLASGAFAALVAGSRPWFLPLLLLPTLFVYRVTRVQQRFVRQAEDGLARAELDRANLAAIVEATTDFVGTSAQDGTLLYANAAARHALGIGPDDDLRGTRMDQLFSEWRSAVRAAVSGGAWSGETTAHLPGGERPVSQVVVAHRGEDGGVAFLSTVARDMSDRKELEERLAHLANHDSLTGLANRRYFEDTVAAYLRGTDPTGALLLLDLDGFKNVNDTLGHATGDQVLIDVADRLVTALGGRPGSAARLGGDEFAALLPGASPEEARRTATDIAAACAGLTLRGEPALAGITASIGLALIPKNGRHVEQLLGHADAAMYAAKRAAASRRAS